MAGPKIEVIAFRESLGIEVNDYELFDWLEDLIAETHGLVPDFYGGVEEEHPTKNTMYFCKGVGWEALNAIIDSLDWAEATRIYQINNAR